MVGFYLFFTIDIMSEDFAYLPVHFANLAYRLPLRNAKSGRPGRC